MDTATRELRHKTKGAAKFKPGDRVTCLEYDRSERSGNRAGRAVVKIVEEAWGCESGWLVTAQTEHGWPITLDQNWLEHDTPTLPV